MRRFSLDRCPSTPWRNGGGLTREIARGASRPATANEWDWRLSVASITASGPFSTFAGVDRVAALVDGALLLDARSAARSWTAQGEVHDFQGDDEFFCRLAAPCVFQAIVDGRFSRT
ncbi:HutD/Ves family protein [Verminephrobacter eiseniae]|uniref:HutD/Ves family protein n=1 Tax=Verminephrobacter eiseniae TaxID=364317 RepID=UPI0010E057BB|nr:HutD family protein [Verminephrobacter eiseniae]KAB7597681.1 HutD family protein [Verminephrobacter sp. Larva24]MCW5230149.1 hypothetical protein [Verminephrobacter eiseniae]MCW5291881.1 hypothetical protein [Verminephrobacter eiseniae]MCW8187592.1 hypothetical protein [Verminephrobacter eiseniae]MCW8225903.1 hypothetical protein [Verminephrobacter eiseniae]